METRSHSSLMKATRFPVLRFAVINIINGSVECSMWKELYSSLSF